MKFKKLMAALMTSALLIGGSAPSFATNAATPDAVQAAVDGFAAQLESDMASKKQSGTAAQNAIILQNDTAATSSADCNNLTTTAAEQAKALVNAKKPPDPSKIIQNTTCFVDVATVQIPILMTGISFIDQIIKGVLQKYLTGACAKSTGFLNDLQTSAMNSFNTATGGYGGVVMSYANDPGASLVDLQNAGSQAANQLGGAVNDVSAQTAAIQVAARHEACTWGVPDAEFCPMCYDNPYHNSCMGPVPYCGAQWPNLYEPKCIQLYNGNGNGQGG